MSDGPNNFSSLVHSIALSAQSAIQSKWTAVLLRSEDGDWLVTSADTRADAPFIRLRHNSQVPKWLESQDAVLRSSEPFLEEPAVPFDEWDEALFEEHGVQLAAPIMNEGNLIGVLISGPGVAGNVYPVSSLNYLKSVSNIAGLAIGGHADSQGEKQGNEADDRLLRRMAHDLKGPLATVMSYLDLVRQNKAGNLTEDQIKRIDKASKSGRRLHRLLNDFVDYARLTTGNMGLDRTEFELASLESDLRHELEPLLAARNQQFRCTISTGHVTIWADHSRIIQTIVTLVRNASQYSEENSPVDLEMWSEGNRLRVRVVDQGRGMTEEQVEKALEPFDPDQPSRRSESDQVEAGSGLGLVLARGLVQLHGGELTIKSSAGKGTVAEIDVPAVLAGEGSQSEAA